MSGTGRRRNEAGGDCVIFRSAERRSAAWPDAGKGGVQGQVSNRLRVRGWASGPLRTTRRLPDEVAAIAEVRPKLGQEVARRYGIGKVYGSAAEMLAGEKLDGIVASQPFNRHGVMAPELLQAGVPVFTEKPLAASVEVGERIVKAVAESGTWHMVGYHKRSDPASMYAREEMDRLSASASWQAALTCAS